MLARAAVLSEDSTWRGSVSKFIHMVVDGCQFLTGYWTETLSFSWPRVPLSFSAHGPPHRVASGHGMWILPV